MRTTDGTLLDGRVPYAQPAEGFRSGIEPVLLAAAIAARPGETALETGTGAGAALLCLTARVAGLRAAGIERDAALAALAARNLAAAGQKDAYAVVADASALPFGAVFDHAFSNPPYHGAAGTQSPDAARRAAKIADAALFPRWAAAMAGALRHRGTLTLILPAAALPAGMAAMAACGCAASLLFPFWPMAGRPAKLVLLRGVKGGRSALRLPPGLTLHAPDGRFTAEADAVLRGGEALNLG